MASALKCPNPGCPYLFDPSRVPAGVVLCCPRCGMRFTLGLQAPAAAPTQHPPPAPGAPTVAQPPPATYTGVPTQAYHSPEPPTVVQQTVVARTHPPAPPAQPAPPGRPHGREPSPGRRQTIALVVVAAALMAGTALTVYFTMFGGDNSRGGGTGIELADMNLAFEPPPAPWVRDEDLKAKLGSPVRLVFRRADPDAVMAFGARDFETRNPRPSELRDGLTGPLSRVFVDLQRDEVSGARWLGRPAASFGFRAQARDGTGTVAGECHAVAHQGMGYWSICWAAEHAVREQLSVFEATRGRFRLLDPRDQWKEREPAVTRFHGDRADYTLLDAEGIWKDAGTRPEEADPRADLHLRASVKRKGQDFREEAELLVYILDGGGGDPLADARGYVEAKRSDEVRRANPAFAVVFKELTGEPEGDPTPNTVGPATPVVRLHSTVPGSSSQARLIVISAVRAGDRVVAVHAWCQWTDRAEFEMKLVQIAGSLRSRR
jgi:hypothetical protein